MQSSDRAHRQLSPLAEDALGNASPEDVEDFFNSLDQSEKAKKPLPPHDCFANSYGDNKTPPKNSQ